MTPGTLNLTIRKGAVFPGVALQCYDAEGADAAVVDLTGYTALAVVRKRPDSEVILDLTPVMTDAATGLITLPELPHTVTMNLKPGGYVWDLILVDADGKRSGPYVSGAVAIVAVVTHP